ncbi:Hypothetical protein NF53_2818 [Bacillus thuringiensis serovar indiana]|nr:Hypothetical protein NF53_2818 [Bacillus thuringiensis serovar indiana]ETE95921.1 hypothetical protein C621_0201225 [Bacillus thuringiensis serovar aizawai str. Leapi01]ETE99389.1 hypothetical protein C623_0204395 [Bacillus thuringiensis serovar aizawai str. Hu4-2]QDD84207.1 hypothetical protein FORC087_2912 [Bacillus cereus]
MISFKFSIENWAAQKQFLGQLSLWLSVSRYILKIADIIGDAPIYSENR